jgi:hypothetical protein
MRATFLWAGLALLPLLAGLTGCAGSDRFPTRTYNMGDRIELGHIIYNVFDTQWKIKLGDGPGEVLPKNRFLLVRLMVTNSGNVPVMVPAINLVDDQDQTHGELASADAVPQWLGFIRQIGPVESMQGNIAFDVPPAHYRLKVSDQDETRSAYIDLPLTFNSETQSMPNSK